jgi:hypothetical protein
MNFYRLLHADAYCEKVILYLTKKVFQKTYHTLPPPPRNDEGGKLKKKELAALQLFHDERPMRILRKVG